MGNESREQEEIKKYILRKIALDDIDVITKTADNFGISESLVKSHIEQSLNNELIMKNEERECGYQLVERSYFATVSLADAGLNEDRLFDTYIAKQLRSCCNDAAFRIWQYACAEMLNNAIEHSRGSELYIRVYTNCLNSKVVIVDNGVGVFRNLLEYMEKNGWNHPSVEDAVLELYKGKITSKESNHSGEGIFFTSKMMDQYTIWSDASIFVSGNNRGYKVKQSHLLAYASRIEKIGTMVFLCLENETERKIAEVFDMYTDIEDGFVKTLIPIKDVCSNGAPVARSQARRICERLDEFKEVILDFSDVEYMGQGFSDELFRVYAKSHPQVILMPINMAPDVRRMIFHVSRGNVPENIKGLKVE
uniref:STAS-like domain-containing protein n=1 Tax=Acetatifactor sp. TaxID=1872090 RepID=UPI004055A4B3